MKLEFIHLCVDRPGGIRAVEDATLEFDSEKTDAAALLGANGAGKSTLLEAALGLIPIASGRIVVDGLEPKKGNLTAIRRKIGMLFQNSDDQLFSQTVREDVAFGPTNMRLPPDEVSARAEKAMARFGISHLAERDVTRLSGGEKRRVALAGVFAMSPEAIFLDEPTSMLDPRASRELADLLNSLGSFKLIATHDLAFAAKTCSDCVLLKQGKVFAAGKTNRILERRDLLAACGLE